jgi:DNA repair exonuclease SbcCD ATPase subunit
MKLHRLQVTHFAAVREADIEFRPGLNVLYGPNDLGKSTLVEAIRLAFLLPHASTSCEPFVGWTGGRDPVVDLTFETEPQRIWRVRKEFGKGGSSLLQESKNGRDFDDVERGRKVDGKLREILRWGIPEPGGSGGSKGIPSSFLATALLSTQADVTAMLRDSLDDDPTATGKERIAAALQAVAQDPLFVALLRSTQERRDEAYTDKGAKKTAKGSVFKTAAERVKETREEKERLQKVVADSEGAEKLLQALNEKRTQRQEALAIAAEHATTLERLAIQAADRTVAAEQVRLAHGNVQRILKIKMDVEETEHKSSELLNIENAARQALTVAQNAKIEADSALKAADEAARAEGSDSSVSDTVARQQLELRIAAAGQAASIAQQRIDAAVAAQTLVEAAVQAETDHREQQTKAQSALESATQAATEEQIVNDDLRRCDSLERALDVRSAEKQSADCRTAVDRLLDLRSRVDVASKERSVLVERRSPLAIPSSSQLASMRQLANALAAARGALDVGLVLTLTPKRLLDIAIRKDDNASDSVSTAESFEIEANAQVEIDIVDSALVRVRGGRREAQEKIRTLEERWNLEVAPHLAAVGATDLAGLDAKVVEVQELDGRIKAKDTEIESLQSQIETLTGAQDALRTALDRLDNCRNALGNVAIETLSADLDTLGADTVDGLRRRRQQSSKALDTARSLSAEATKAYTLAEERARNLRSLLEAAVERRDLALRSFPEGVAEALAAARSDLVSANAEAQGATAELASFDKTMALRKARIEEAIADARLTAEKAHAALESAQAQLTEAMTTRAAQLGRLAELKKVRDAEDLSAAETKLRETTECFSALPVPERNVTKDEVNAAKNAEGAVRLELDSIDREIHRAHGALEQVGGAVARERLRDATEAFELAQQQEREIEADYEAWKLLLDQMKEADAAQASNLGLAIAPAIASRFQALTDRRYETVRLTAALGMEGVVVAGAVRSSERISVGTREQLSTLYRLALAEYLQTAVVLDDQLVQSDEIRMGWFRALLKEKSHSFQIIVFTCRPRDYLEKGALVPKGKPFCDTEDGFIRAVDLGRALGQGQVSAKVKPE